MYICYCTHFLKIISNTKTSDFRYKPLLPKIVRLIILYTYCISAHLHISKA